MATFLPVSVALLCTGALASARSDVRSPHSTQAPQPLVTGSVCADHALAQHGAPVPGGGTLDLSSSFDAAELGAQDTLAFFARVTGSTRNQGIFVATPAGLVSIVRGSGGGWQSGSPGPAVGDLSPLGGRFTGIDPSSLGFARSGDVAFRAEVQGGSATSGLFLYRASTQTIVALAALGALAPNGQPLLEIGPASINSLGSAVFLARTSGFAFDYVMRWDNGVLSALAAAGDPAPTLGNYSDFRWTQPDIDDQGRVLFTATESAFSVLGTVLVDSSGSNWLAKSGDPLPNGHSVFQVWEALLDDSGGVAFYCTSTPPGGGLSDGWFAGQPGNWRSALLEGQALAGGVIAQMVTFATIAHSPLWQGDLVVWAQVTVGAGQKHVLALSRADGTVEVIREQGDASSLGGTLGPMGFAPSINAEGQVLLSCSLQGAGGIAGARFVLDLCPLVQSYCTAGTSLGGCSATMSGQGAPSASAPNGFTLTASGAPGQRSGLIFYGIDGRVALPWASGSTSWMCVKSPLQRTSVQNSGGTAGQCNGVFSLDFNAYRTSHAVALGQPMHAGQRFDAQAWFRDPGAPKNTNLSDALEFWLAP